MQAEVLRAKVAAFRAAYDEIAACAIDTVTHAELLPEMDELEALACQLPALRHRMQAQLQAQTTPRELGAKSWREVVMTRWRLSSAEASRRITEAAVLGPRKALSGEPLGPVLPATAAAQALGLVTDEHVAEIRKGVAKLPGFVDDPTRTQIEVDWVRKAVGTGPKALADTVKRTVFLLDQDGPAPDDAERARRRGMSVGPQQPNGMIHATADFTPAAWAAWEALYAKFAAPGMCNPDDEHPCTSGTPTQEQIDSDTRTLAQRRHDAMAFIGRQAVTKGELGQHNGLPTTIIVRTTLQDLESRAGIGVTGGGTLLPVSDVLNLAAQANSHHYLAVFDQATGSALDLFRARRTASVAQRLMLIARDGGCTKPSCTVTAYGCQVHHAALDWTDGGETNVNDNALACGCDNRMVGPDGWTTRINDQHEVEWIPPPHLDTGQTRINDYHQPEKLRPPPDDAWTPPTPDDNRAGDEPSADNEHAVEEPTSPDSTITAQDWIDAWAPDEPPADDETWNPHDPPVYEALPDGDERAGDEPPAENPHAVEEPTPPDSTITAQDWIDAWAPDEPSAPDQTCSPHGPPAHDESTTNDDNRTRASSDPDPPDGKAA